MSKRIVNQFGIFEFLCVGLLSCNNSNNAKAPVVTPAPSSSASSADEQRAGIVEGGAPDSRVDIDSAELKSFNPAAAVGQTARVPQQLPPPTTDNSFDDKWVGAVIVSSQTVSGVSSEAKIERRTVGSESHLFLNFKVLRKHEAPLRCYSKIILPTVKNDGTYRIQTQPAELCLYKNFAASPTNKSEEMSIDLNALASVSLLPTPEQQHVDDGKDYHLFLPSDSIVSWDITTARKPTFKDVMICKEVVQKAAGL